PAGSPLYLVVISLGSIFHESFPTSLSKQLTSNNSNIIPIILRLTLEQFDDTNPSWRQKSPYFARKAACTLNGMYFEVDVLQMKEGLEEEEVSVDIIHRFEYTQDAKQLIKIERDLENFFFAHCFSIFRYIGPQCDGSMCSIKDSGLNIPISMHIGIEPFLNSNVVRLIVPFPTIEGHFRGTTVFELNLAYFDTDLFTWSGVNRDLTYPFIINSDYLIYHPRNSIGVSIDDVEVIDGTFSLSIAALPLELNVDSGTKESAKLYSPDVSTGSVFEMSVSYFWQYPLDGLVIFFSVGDPDLIDISTSVTTACEGDDDGVCVPQYTNLQSSRFVWDGVSENTEDIWTTLVFEESSPRGAYSSLNHVGVHLPVSLSSEDIDSDLVEEITKCLHTDSCSSTIISSKNRNRAISLTFIDSILLEADEDRITDDVVCIAVSLNNIMHHYPLSYIPLDYTVLEQSWNAEAIAQPGSIIISAPILDFHDVMSVYISEAVEYNDAPFMVRSIALTYDSVVDILGSSLSDSTTTYLLLTHTGYVVASTNSDHNEMISESGSIFIGNLWPALGTTLVNESIFVTNDYFDYSSSNIISSYSFDSSLSSNEISLKTGSIMYYIEYSELSFSALCSNNGEYYSDSSDETPSIIVFSLPNVELVGIIVENTPDIDTCDEFEPEQASIAETFSISSLSHTAPYILQGTHVNILDAVIEAKETWIELSKFDSQCSLDMILAKNERLASWIFLVLSMSIVLIFTIVISLLSW
ncbi:hypothetical protein ADUPG1_009058, partial [Aduncisulcus paluster]